MVALADQVLTIARELAPMAGIGTGALLRHPVWTVAARDGGGTGVVVVPGFGGTDANMCVLRSWLDRRGYVAVGAGLGMNVGCTAELVDRLEQRAAEHARRTGGPVVLLGHSRGGWIARLVAVRRPDLVRGVLMLGSPVLDPLDARGVAVAFLGVLLRLSALGLRGVLDADCVGGACREETAVGLAAPLLVPAVAIYSRSDGVVGWRSCRDPHAEWVEVRSTHSGMGIDPELYLELAPRLAAWAAGHAPSSSTLPESAVS